MAQTVKSLPVMQKTWIPSLDGEDLLEKGMATHSTILVWRISWTEESGGLQSVGSQENQTQLSDYTITTIQPSTFESFPLTAFTSLYPSAHPADSSCRQLKK